MNTKKITALALAALMAAGSTATSFADNYVANAGNDLDAKRPLTFNDDVIYEENDGVLKPSDDFRPGDTLYIRLDELNSNGDKKIEDEKDDMKVYADWKVGKDAVKSIDIIYKKGNYNSSMAETTYTFTVDGVPFEIKGADITSNLNDAIKAELVAYQAAHPDFLKDEIAAELVKFTVTDGFVNSITKEYTAKSENKYGVVDTKNGFTNKSANKYYEDADLAKFVRATFTHDGSKLADLYLEDASKNKTAIKAKASTAGGYTQETNKQDYMASGNSGDFVVVLAADVPATDDGATNVTKADLIDADVAAAGVATTVFDKNTNDKAKSITRIKGTAYVVDGKVVGLADAQKAAVSSAISNEIVNASGSVDRVFNNKYTYWVEIKTKEDDTTKVLDLAGVLRIGSTKNKAEDAKNQFKLDNSLDNRVDDSNDKYVVVDDEWTFKPDSRSVVKFDKDAEDVVLYFGENEAAWYEFDARGQDALNLEFTFDFNKEIADLFPKANIDFLTFTSKPATNRTGDLYITADEDTFLYEVTEDGVKEIKGAEYIEEEGAWHIRTRKLGAYAISDIELDTSVKVEGKDEASSNSSTSSKPNGDKHNPDTGR